jgi:hypothetical protein
LILLAFWLTGWSNGKQETMSSIRELQEQKAEYTYVDKKYEEHIAVDNKQDAIMETMRKEWREDQKEIREDQKEIIRLIGGIK